MKNRLLSTIALATGLFVASLPAANSQVGVAHSWGYNFHGELGIGSILGKRTPQTTLGISGVSRVAGGGDHSLFLKSNGTVWACGLNSSGQLGDGTVVDKLKPVQTLGITTAVQVAAGAEHSYALLKDGAVLAWGRNDSNELGDGTSVNKNAPAPVIGLSQIVQIASGHNCGIALRADGTVWTWGYNGNGQLGIGSGVNKSAPVQVTALANIVQVAGSWAHMLALRADGTVWTWGVNADGQLGDGTNINQFTPVQAVGIANAIQIAGGGVHSLALLADHTVSAWGGNENGGLGDGTQVSRNTPGAVFGLFDVVQIAEGLYHSLAIKSDGSVWAWGYNGQGQAGVGSDNDVIFEPTPLTSLKGQNSIAAGVLHSLSVQSAVQATKLTPATITTTYGKPVNLVASLKNAATGMLLPNQPVAFQLDGTDLGIARTIANGKASIPAPLDKFGGVGTHNISVAFSGDITLSLSRGTAILTVNKADSYIKASSTTGRPGDAKTLKATLRRKGDNAPISGVELLFKVDGASIGSAISDGTGVATVPFKVQEATGIGAHVILVEFQANPNYNASSGTGALTVSQAPTKLSVSSASAKAGATVSLIAKLKRTTDSQMLANRQIAFSLDGMALGEATTDSAGVATFHYGVPLGTTKGTHALTAEFKGDVFYLSSVASGALAIK